jgi:type IV pilus assembly protein PilM
MLGIDTGSYALKFCLSEAQGKDFALRRVGEFVLLSEKAPLTSEGIRLFFHRNRLPREVTLSFSHPRMVFQRVSFPEMPQEELENTLQWEARSLIPDEENFQVSWSIVGKNGGKMEVLFAAVPLQEVERYVDVFSRAGVRVEAVEPHVTSLVKGFLGLHPEFFEQAFTLVDIGFGKTTLICFANHHVLLSRSFSWGMKRLWDALSEEFHLSPVEAFEVLRRGEGTAGIPYQLEEAIPLVSPDLVSELKRSFAFFQAEFGARVLEQIFLLGGGALCRPLRSYVAQGLSLDFQTPRPLTLGKDSIASERFLAALGASLWK